ncbi:MAG: MerR family transcriptional regulator [Propionibacteriaceae bacterium]|jgi:MerR family transcriptional regulator/heat shock protein HspR|nr:MerR family transcriptional regulator [Propionibacteriaceae bacterium]
MSGYLPDKLDADAPIFVISVAAQLADMHPQTLRGYDRLGLVVPGRARGRGRRYSLRDIARLRHIQYLSQTEGINLEGVRRILALESELEGMRDQLARLAEIVAQVQEGRDRSRVFTAEQSGQVHLGRIRPRQLRAIGR